MINIKTCHLFLIFYFRLKKNTIYLCVVASTDDTAQATPTDKAPEVKKKKPMPPLPGGGMRREKTVVEQAAEITDNQKQKMINMLMREQTSLAVKIGKEKTRQEELVCFFKLFC